MGSVTVTINDLPGDAVGIVSDPPLAELLKLYQADGPIDPAVALALFAMNALNDEAVQRGLKVHR